MIKLIVSDMDGTLLNSNNEKIQQQMKRKLEFINGLTINSNCTKSIEINDVNAQKGLILVKAAQKMGIKKDENMVI